MRSIVLLAARLSALTAAGDQGLWLNADGYIVQSATTGTSFGAGLATSATGLVGTAQVFAFKMAQRQVLTAFAIAFRIPWTLTANNADAAARATLRVTLSIAGVVIATADGLGRATNAANATRYIELVRIAMVTAQIIDAGQEITITVQPLITVAGAGGTVYTPTLDHDPQTPDAQMVAEFQAMAA